MSTAYDYITSKIKSLKDDYASLRDKPNYYIFSILCVKAHLYKNPSHPLNENDFAKIVVDGQYDGGADILLSNPNSESSHLVIVQSKFYKSIKTDDVLNAMLRMADFYNDMQSGHYEQVNEQIQRRFISLNDEVDDESKIDFVFYTSAPRNRIDKENIKRKFREQIKFSGEIAVTILFAEDIKKELEDEETRTLIVNDKIRIDDKDNYLLYGYDAVIVNVSAFSLKHLYGKYDTKLLARNLRYHISGKLDGKIRKTIREAPESFWLKNNGVTIICDSFDIDGIEVKLRNFSIVNGGQTTYVIHGSKSIDTAHDLWLPCKIIKTKGKTEDEKNQFSLDIAEAANSQKAITPADLKANAPEQRRFANAMLEVGVLYQTKRGEIIKKPFQAPYLHTKLTEVGKLCLAAIFQEPCKSRTNPSASYRDDKYYIPIFNGNQKQITAICKELLYIDKYFDTFISKFEVDNKDTPNLSFARLARRICVAFTALAARYHQGNIKDVPALMSRQSDFSYKALCDLGEMKSLFPEKFLTDKDLYDAALNKLFEIIIEEGSTAYFYAHKGKPDLTETNFMKNDRNYYEILINRWSTLRREINKIFVEATPRNSS